LFRADRWTDWRSKLWLFAVLQTLLRSAQAVIDKSVPTEAQLFTWPGHVDPV